MVYEKWYFVTKIVLTYCEKNYSTDQEKNLQKFWDLQTVKGQNDFW